MLDEDLADLYGVETAALTRAVRRNKDRFPDDFMFRLSKDEFDSLRCQFGISNEGRGGRRYMPYVFTEQGVAMLSGVLRSKRAVVINIEIMRAFVELRSIATSHGALRGQIDRLERNTVARLGQHDKQIADIFKILKELVTPRPKPKRPIGFRASDD
jgi:hypothetical protein